MPPPKSLRNRILEVGADLFEGHDEFLAAFLVDPLDELFELLFALVEVLDLLGQEFVPFFQLVLLLDGVHIDIAQPLDLVLERR